MYLVERDEPVYSPVTIIEIDMKSKFSMDILSLNTLQFTQKKKSSYYNSGTGLKFFSYSP